ncbi:MAG: TolC family protein, partial [Pseudomonadota bacterium]
MLPFAIALVATVERAQPASPSDRINETTLAALVWRHSPDVVSARAAIVDAEAAEQRANLYPNPSLLATWGTIPIGRRNPSNVAFGQVPNYTVGASQLFELGKRGPRGEAAREGVAEARFALRDLYRQRFLDVLRAVGEQATAVGRAAVLERLTQSSDETLRLQKVRAAHGDVAGLEVDRLEVEHLRLLSSLGAARAASESAAAGCALLLGGACPRFETLEAALGYLATPAGVNASGAVDAVDAAGAADEQAIARRPDLQMLGATERRAHAEGVLAARHKIPDPTVVASFTRDQFVVAGNQPDSVTLSLALPLPLFDRGQPEAARAVARADLASR